MEFLPENIDNYSAAHTQEESELLAKINRETFAQVMKPRMLSGHMQGRILSMFSHMIQPTNILEIGTYTGYSALCLAEGLQTDGKLITIDINEELHDMVARYVGASDYRDQIQTLTGDAIKLIPEIDLTFDLVFIDADKENYANYYRLIFDKVRQGGIIIADNVLWSGNILKPVHEMDIETRALHDFNEMINRDERVENVLFPVRDGLMIIRKK